ncbi:MAG: sensor histidine kinase [Acidimicrobiales bacterium]
MSGDPSFGGPPKRMVVAFTERHWLAIVVLAALVGLATIVLALEPRPRDGGARLTLALLACGPMVLLRRWPLPVLIAAVAAAGVVIASGTAPLPVAVLLGLATYLVSSRVKRRISIAATAAAAVTVGGALLYAALNERSAPLAVLSVEGFMPLGAAWFVGDAVAARRRYQAGLAEQAKREQATEAERARQQIREERVRIARELHDVVAHTLAVITIQAGVARRLMTKHPEKTAGALELIEEIGRTAQDELRVVLGLLRDEAVEPISRTPAPRLADLKELVETVRASGIQVELRTTGAGRFLSPAIELSIYRVVQEALTNVVRHAPGAQAVVALSVTGNNVCVEIADNGGPSRATGEERPLSIAITGHGIVGMRERVEAFGGSLLTEHLANGGFHVSARIPVENLQ